MCAYPQFDCALTHWKCVLRCCYNCPCINIPDQEKDNQYSGTTPSTKFHIYHIIACCTAHVIIPSKDKKIFRMCKQEYSSDESTIIYTRKELVMMGKTIYYFHKSFYIPEIQRLYFRLPHVGILCTTHCGKFQCTAFKRRKLFQDVLFCWDYAEREVSRFAHQIQSEYCDGNRSVSIEGIELEYFIALPKEDINSTTQSR